MRKHLFTLSISIVSFILGLGVMYYLANSRASKQSEALNTSQRLTDNCYEAFDTVSACSTEGGCDVVVTANTLSKLNRERKNLEFELSELTDPTHPFFWNPKPH